ncbi:hypothetical protein EMN47_04620 [Prolixibacteraceae bacterium JC049]|nr:hypothetical protein [Prolixibacteraceae bacterium JC049]
MKPINKRLTFCAVCLLSLLLKSGLAQTFSGKILSAVDSSAVAFGHIGVPKLGIGTITNIDGEFSFYNGKGKIDSVLFSHVAFQKLKLPFKRSIIDTVIYLKPLENELDMIVVTPQDSINLWFMKAIQNIPKNYPRQLHFFDAFYRETQFDGVDRLKYTRLIEADISVQDRGYKQTTNAIRIKVNQLRKSDDNARKMLLSVVLGKIFGENNYMYEVLKRAHVRSYFQLKRKGFVNELHRIYKDIRKGNREDRLKLKKVIKRDGGEKLYVLEFVFNYPLSVVTVEYYINSANYAIEKINLSSDVGHHAINEYVSINDVYFPLYFYRVSYSGKKVTSENAGLGYSENLLMVNRHYFKKEHEKISRRFKVDSEKDLYKSNYAYDPEFWQNYNMVVREPLSKDAVQDLSKKKSLQEQFIQNGK